MSVSPEEVARVAELAELAVGPDELPRLADEFNDIIDFVAQLEQVPVTREDPAPVVGPARAPLRDDVVASVPLSHAPGDLAPEFADGLYLVPRRGAMEDA